MDIVSEEVFYAPAALGAVEEELRRWAAERPVILLSGGKDSAFLASCVCKFDLQDRFRFAHLSSPLQILSERSALADLARDLALDVELWTVPVTGHLLGDENVHFFSFWNENPFGGKRRAVERYLGDSAARVPILTGEIGAGHFDLEKYLMTLMTLADDPRLTEHLARQIVNTIHSFGRDSSLTENAEQSWYETYLELVSHFRERLGESGAPGFLNRVFHLGLEEIGCYRLFHYSQDKKIRWHHPFAQWPVISQFVACPPNLKYRQNRLEKAVYFELLGDKMSRAPWRYPKLGLSILAKDRYRMVPHQEPGGPVF